MVFLKLVNPPRGRQVLHLRWIWGIHYTQTMTLPSEQSTLVLKPRADVTRSPKHGSQKRFQKILKKDVPGLFPSLVTLCLVAPELVMHTNWVSVRDTASMSHSESSNLIYKKGKEIVKQNRMFFCRVKWGVRGMDSKLFKYFLLTFITYWLKTISNYLTFCSMNWSTMCNSKRIKMNWVNWATFI